MSAAERPARVVFAGSCAGITSTVFCHPMDTVRTRLQSSPYVFRGVMNCILATLRDEGPLAFYKGMAFPLAAQAVYKAVIFSINGTARGALRRRGHGDSTAGVFACGALSGGANAFVVTPVELVRNRLMVQCGGPSGDGGGGKAKLASFEYRSPVDCVRRVAAKDGVAALWRGITPTILRDAPGMGVYFVTFDRVKAWLTRPTGSSSSRDSTAAAAMESSSSAAAAAGAGTGLGSAPPDPQRLGVVLVAGSAAGVAFWTVALPFDGVKTVMQTAEGAAAGDSTLAAAARMLRDGGVAALYRGWPVALGRGIPGAALTLTTYDYVMRWLDGGGQGGM